MAFIFGYFGSILGFFILGGIWGLVMALNSTIENMAVNPLYTHITRQGKWTFIIFLPVASIISTIRKLANYLPVWAILYLCMRLANMSSEVSSNNILFLAFCFGIIHACNLSKDYYKSDKRTPREKFVDEYYDIVSKYWVS